MPGAGRRAVSPLALICASLLLVPRPAAHITTEGAPKLCRPASSW